MKFTFYTFARYSFTDFLKFGIGWVIKHGASLICGNESIVRRGGLINTQHVYGSVSLFHGALEMNYSKISFCNLGAGRLNCELPLLAWVPLPSFKMISLSVLEILLFNIYFLELKYLMLP